MKLRVVGLGDLAIFTVSCNYLHHSSNDTVLIAASLPYYLPIVVAAQAALGRGSNWTLKLIYFHRSMSAADLTDQSPLAVDTAHTRLHAENHNDHVASNPAFFSSPRLRPMYVTLLPSLLSVPTTTLLFQEEDMPFYFPIVSNSSAHRTPPKQKVLDSNP